MRLRALFRTRPAAGLSRGLVLMYHRVAEDPVDPWKLCVSPSNFRRHLALLQRRGIEVMTCEAAAKRLPQLPRRFAAITFDDGYADNYQHALPALQEAGTPATLFVTAGAVAESREYWWDAVARVFLRTVSLPAVFEGSTIGMAGSWDLGKAAERDPATLVREASWVWKQPPPSLRQEMFVQVWQHLAVARPGQRDAALSSLLDWAGLDRQPLPDCRPMTPDELQAMSQSRLIEIGAHTWAHAMLPDLAPEEQAHDLAHTRAWLRDVTGQDVEGCSYPHGRYSPATVSAARAAGHSYACCSSSKALDSAADVMALPRVVVNDWDDARFDAMLSEHLGPL